MATPMRFNFTEHEKLILRSLAIGSASLSVCAGLIMTYWFMQLRNKTFRHQLVMLLIISDLCKALVELIYPILVLHRQEVSPAACNALGFINATFIESTDFAILVIAVHTALCIFAPGRGKFSLGEGLYRWRHSLFVLWALWGLLMASLAFINPGRAYVSSTSWCYLPIRPFYWRIALSWAPRYVILLFLLCLYISIYVYVRRKFKSFAELFRDQDGMLSSQDGFSQMSSDYQMGRPPQQTACKTDDEPVAELKTHHLLEVTSDHSPYSSLPNSTAAAVEQRRGSLIDATNSGSTDASLSPEALANLPPRKQSVISISLPPQLESRRPSVLSLQNSALPAASGSSSRKARGNTFGLQPFMSSMQSGTFHGSDQRSGRSASLGTHHTHGEVSVQEAAQVPMKQQRAVVVKQLKHLFIYPIVYFLMWLIPFCYHMTQYSDRYIQGPVFALACISAFIIPAHGFIDVLVYARTEKPWRSLRFMSKEQRRHRQAIRQGLRKQQLDNAGTVQHKLADAEDRPARWWQLRAWTRRNTHHARELEERRESDLTLEETRPPDSASERLAQGKVATDGRGPFTSPLDRAVIKTGRKSDWWDLEEEALSRDLEHARFQAGLSPDDSDDDVDNPHRVPSDLTLRRRDPLSLV